MKAIVGRLSDLGVRELFKLLTAVRAEGALEFETPVGRAGLEVKHGHVAGESSAPLVAAYANRIGTFSFRPGQVASPAEWLPVEEFLARLEADAALVASAGSVSARTRGGSPADPLEELRDSLADVPLPPGATVIRVVAADPRPYRALETEWRQRGWQAVLATEPDAGLGDSPAILVIHLPSSSTLAGQGETWLRLLRTAAASRPPVPSIWVGGLADPWLRHQAVLGGASYLLPAPAGEAGETARWFRDELSLVIDRLLDLNMPRAETDAEAFREFFLALQADANPSEVRASLLRFASGSFARGVLLAVREGAFESLGGYGFASSLPPRVPRGVSALEEAVITQQARRGSEFGPGDAAALAGALGVRDGLHDVEVVPVVAKGEVVALFVGDRPSSEGVGRVGVEALFARVGGLLGP
ncbi:MAG: hypothetical protein ACOY3Y_15080 [Acidobacteriota bacterium]